LQDADEVLEKLSKGPKHEVLYTALLLQVIEAMIIAQENKQNNIAASVDYKTRSILLILT
jgi:hypothetical protein